MPQSHSIRIPKYALHKATGQGVVRLSGRDIYLGKHGTPKSQAAYRRVIAEWLAASKHQLPSKRPVTSAVSGLSVSDLTLRYLDLPETYYVKNGRPTGELENIRYARAVAYACDSHSVAPRTGPACSWNR